jgi:hypothetical protein
VTLVNADEVVGFANCAVLENEQREQRRKGTKRGRSDQQLELIMRLLEDTQE